MNIDKSVLVFTITAIVVIASLLRVLWLCNEADYVKNHAHIKPIKGGYNTMVRARRAAVIYPMIVMLTVIAALSLPV